MLGSCDGKGSLGIIPRSIFWLYKLTEDTNAKTGSRFSIVVSAAQVIDQTDELVDLLKDQSESYQSVAFILKSTSRCMDISKKLFKIDISRLFYGVDRFHYIVQAQHFHLLIFGWIFHVFALLDVFVILSGNSFYFYQSFLKVLRIPRAVHIKEIPAI